MLEVGGVNRFLETISKGMVIRLSRARILYWSRILHLIAYDRDQLSSLS